MVEGRGKNILNWKITGPKIEIRKIEIPENKIHNIGGPVWGWADVITRAAGGFNFTWFPFEIRKQKASQFFAIIYIQK